MCGDSYGDVEHCYLACLNAVVRLNNCALCFDFKFFSAQILKRFLIARLRAFCMQRVCLCVN